jgi:hypothetical protein
VVDMKHSAMVLSRGSEFDAFLFAPIVEEKNGMLLSVLSALARLDLDPWREAAELTRMPMETAKQRLKSLIETLPDGPPTRPELETISTRLIALLPCRVRSSIPSSEAFPDTLAVLNSRAFIYVVLVNLIFMAGMMGAQYAAANLHPSANADRDQASSASVVLPPGSPPGSSQ